MAILIMIFRKMLKNKWLEISLLLGLIVTVAMMSSIPIYTNAVLQRMAIKDLEKIQTKNNQFPGSIFTSAYMGELTREEGAKFIDTIDRFMELKAMPYLSLPVLEYVRQYFTNTVALKPDDPLLIDPNIKRTGNIGAINNMNEHIQLVDGRLPSPQHVNGVYEALVTDSALVKLKMVLGNVFQYTDKVKNETIKVKPVGVFTVKPGSELYWSFRSINSYNTSFLIDFNLFKSELIQGQKMGISTSYWNMALDYTKLELSTIPKLLTGTKWIETVLRNRVINQAVKATAEPVLVNYEERSQQLRTLLWSLNIPVILMLAFYLFMVANLITERQKTEISVLRSRGASRLQIVTSYLIEGMILGGIAYNIGPYLGLVFTQMVGASNGFLEFVQRAALQPELNKQAYWYSLAAVIGSIIMTLIPVFMATRTSIVGHKQQSARAYKSFVWHRLWLDIVFMALALYGLRSFRIRMQELKNLGLDSTFVAIDPFIFIIPTMFIVGFGLFLLRIYPWIIKLIYRLGKRWWNPALYSTLVQVGRSSKQYQFFMLFFILTISTGLFSASAARTINQNSQDKISYQLGADMVLQFFWDNDAPPPAPPGAPTVAPVTTVKKRIQFTEPPYKPFTNLPGVVHTAKVFTKDDVVISVSKETVTARLMGIETDQFGQTAWMKDGLLNYHLNDYLNVLAADPKAVLISSTMAERLKIKVGDTMEISWIDVAPAPFVVYGIVDYFPTFNPNQPSGTNNKDTPSPMLVVGNLDYIQNYLVIEPYQVWLKLQDKAKIEPIYNAITERKLNVLSLVNTRDALVDAKRDPFQLSINGMMTLGFIISLLISLFGFLLYWILSLSGRTLQYGVLRAMGISFPQLIAMLVTEQLLTSGAAIGIGALTGYLTSRLFVPVFQLTFDPSTQVPPFEVMTRASDTLQLFTCVMIIVVIGLVFIGHRLARVKIHQAVKLGED